MTGPASCPDGKGADSPTVPDSAAAADAGSLPDPRGELPNYTHVYEDVSSLETTVNLGNDYNLDIAARAGSIAPPLSPVETSGFYRPVLNGMRAGPVNEPARPIYWDAGERSAVDFADPPPSYHYIAQRDSGFENPGDLDYNIRKQAALEGDIEHIKQALTDNERLYDRFNQRVIDSKLAVGRLRLESSGYRGHLTDYESLSEHQGQLLDLGGLPADEREVRSQLRTDAERSARKYRGLIEDNDRQIAHLEQQGGRDSETVADLERRVDRGRAKLASKRQELQELRSTIARQNQAIYGNVNETPVARHEMAGLLFEGNPDGAADVKGYFGKEFVPQKPLGPPPPYSATDNPAGLFTRSPGDELGASGGSIVEYDRPVLESGAQRLERNAQQQRQHLDEWNRIDAALASNTQGRAEDARRAQTQQIRQSLESSLEATEQAAQQLRRSTHANADMDHTFARNLQQQ